MAAPVLSNVPPSITYQEHATAALTLAGSATVADPDSVNLASATVQITGGFSGDGDVLASNGGIGGTLITASYNAATERLTLTGSDTLAHYQQVLDSLVFASGANATNFGANPTRTVTWTLNDGSANSTPVTETINITPNSPPVLSNVPTSVSYKVGNPPLTLAGSATVADPDNTTLTSATVQITGGFSGDGDVMFANVAGTSITASYNAATERLTLTGSDTLAHYQGVLDSLTFSTTSDNRIISVNWQLNDGSPDNNLSTIQTTVVHIGKPPTPRDDFNGNGTSDLLLHNNSNQADSIWLMSGTTVVSSPIIGTQAAGWNITHTADFNGDFKADLLLQNPSTLQASVWLMDGTTVTSSPIIGTEAPGWGIVHTADFNNDNKSDLLLQNGNTLAMWLMDGGTVTSNPVIGTMASGWNLTDYGDFNNDGKTDLLLQNPTTLQASVWLMNGTSVTSSPVIGTEAPGWGVVHTADFNHDGKSDLLLQNGKTLAMWLMDGGTVTSNPVIGTIAPGWNLTHYGDFNGDGKTDLLLENPTTLQAAVWLMNGTTVMSSPVIGTEAPGWGIVDVTDFNADGKSDLLLENSNHDLAVWLMDGTTVTANPVIGHIASGWDFLGV
jgi:hypothetical protein